MGETRAGARIGGQGSFLRPVGWEKRFVQLACSTLVCSTIQVRIGIGGIGKRVWNRKMSPHVAASCARVSFLFNSVLSSAAAASPLTCRGPQTPTAVGGWVRSLPLIEVHSSASHTCFT